jgi:hypothetical protein
MLVRWVSPIRALMKVLSDEKSAGANAVPTSLWAVLCAAVLVAAVLATQAVAGRRE